MRETAITYYEISDLNTDKDSVATCVRSCFVLRTRRRTWGTQGKSSSRPSQWPTVYPIKRENVKLL